MTTTTFDSREFVEWVGSVAQYATDIKNAAAEAQTREDEAQRAGGSDGYTAPDVATSAAAPSVPTSPQCPYETLIRSVWTVDADWAVGIAWRESNCRPDVTSPDGARGLFQLLGHVDDGCAYNAECNVRSAFALYQQCGKGPWSPPYFCTKP